jgi:hypothetical protein
LGGRGFRIAALDARNLTHAPFQHKRYVAVGPFLERGEEIEGVKMSRPTENDKIEQINQDQFRAEPVKRPYSRPVVVAHGNLREITLTVGAIGMTDGGMGLTMFDTA